MPDQVLTMGRLAEARSESRLFAPAAIDALMDEIGLPRPARVSNVMGSLEKGGLLTRVKGARGNAWKLTPSGRGRAEELATDMDLAALIAEAAEPAATVLADTPHPVIPPSLAPPALVGPLHAFLERFPFERNVFGMTRFPGKSENGELDPIAPALETAHTVCDRHGLVFHLASDRSIVDDLWANVAAHMWGCRYGIAFAEERTPRGLNYNLTIEIGSCLVLGRRIALLKDEPVERLPTDLIGHIFTEVNLDDPSTVEAALEDWIKNTLSLSF